MLQMRLLLILVFVSPLVFGGTKSLESWNVNGETRTALVYMPEFSASNKSPLIYIWHGHGGTAENFYQRVPIYKTWPEAIVVFPQGLKSKAPYDIHAERTGWQYSFGDYGDRDIKFFDKMHNHFMNTQAIDITKVHSMGSSNGGQFTYMLLKKRGYIFASVAPAISASIGGHGYVNIDLPDVPILHITGRKERSYANQKALVMKIVDERASQPPKQWKDVTTSQHYVSPKGDLVWYVHSQGHRWRTKDTSLVVDFFKSYPKHQ